jgi:diadenosine tetraphosphate (Ap4A) HIT family hydrolase
MKAFLVEDPDIEYRIVGKNSLAFAFLTCTPIVPGHTLVCPLRVLQTSEELALEEWHAIHQLKNTICSSLQQAFACEGFNFAWNEGSIAGQSVPHFHLHIVPRKQNDAGIWKYEPREFLYRPGSRAKSPNEELKMIAKLIHKI